MPKNQMIYQDSVKNELIYVQHLLHINSCQQKMLP